MARLLGRGRQHLLQIMQLTCFEVMNYWLICELYSSSYTWWDGGPSGCRGACWQQSLLLRADMLTVHQKANYPHSCSSCCKGWHCDMLTPMSFVGCVAWHPACCAIHFPHLVTLGKSHGQAHALLQHSCHAL
jgi:hypothetical protein